MDILYYKLIISSFLILIGFLSILGAKSNVKALVDPPEELWLFWGPSFFQKFGGSKGAKFFSYTMGVIVMCLGLKILWEAIQT